jgi:hypothetical protein
MMAEPKFNKAKKHSIIRGVGNVEYRQDGSYFDVRGAYLGPAPAQEGAAPPKNERVTLTLRKKGVEREEILRRSEALIARQGGIPKSVADAAKENEKAFEAESQAD